MKNDTTFPKFLRHLMDERSLSLRKLGEISGIDHATLSKIMHGKRKVNITHLQKLSIHLDIELSTLIDAAGYNTTPTKQEDSEMHESVVSIQKLIKVTNIHDGDFTVQQVKQEIANYQNFSQTPEGKAIIRQEFQNKLDKTDSMGAYITQLRTMFSRFITKKGTAREMTLMGAALLYFIVTTDLIPDYLLPIGFLDDALIMQTISQHMENKKLS